MLTPDNCCVDTGGIDTLPDSAESSGEHPRHAPPPVLPLPYTMTIKNESRINARSSIEYIQQQ